MVLDVVCQMEVDEKVTKWKSEYKGETYYFCAPMCKQKFDRNPEKYIKPTQIASVEMANVEKVTNHIGHLAESMVFKERIKRAGELMEKAGLDSILLTEPQNITYI